MTVLHTDEYLLHYTVSVCTCVCDGDDAHSVFVRSGFNSGVQGYRGV